MRNYTHCIFGLEVKIVLWMILHVYLGLSWLKDICEVAHWLHLTNRSIKPLLVSGSSLTGLFGNLKKMKIFSYSFVLKGFRASFVGVMKGGHQWNLQSVLPRCAPILRRSGQGLGCPNFSAPAPTAPTPPTPTPTAALVGSMPASCKS